jgi:nickel/cobalt exporter
MRRAAWPSRRTCRLLLLLAAVGALWASAAPAQAHPLGNFTVNRYARLEVSAGVVRVLYVLDLAEIPAFQERRAVAADPEAYARQRAEEIRQGLELVVDGLTLDLVLTDHLLQEPPGQGGLTTLRLTALYAADLPGGAPDDVHEATFRDQNQPDRIGWREIVVVAEGDAEILDSDAAQTDISDELRSYPEDRLEAPLDQRQAGLAFTAGSEPSPPPALDGRDETVGATDGFAALITRTDLSPSALAVMLALAVGFGAVHAVGPGHGKTVMAAYLVGTTGKPRDAVLLGGTVSIMHTASVLVLGAVLLRVDSSIATDEVYPALALVSGLAVTAIGGWLLVRRSRRLRSASPGQAHHHHGDHDHGPGHGDHGHGHGDHGHSHDLPADVKPLSWRGLVALGTSGGLFPSPSAVLVLVSAVGLGRAGLGLALLGAFSVGLAATLTVVGLALVYGRTVIQRRLEVPGVRFLPVVGAVALVGLGVVVTARAVAQF